MTIKTPDYYCHDLDISQRPCPPCVANLRERRHEWEGEAHDDPGYPTSPADDDRAEVERTVAEQRRDDAAGINEQWWED